MATFAYAVRKSALPAALLAALCSPFALSKLEQLEDNVLRVYADPLARGLPTFCAGRTDPEAIVGTRLTSDQCAEINRGTLVEYGLAIAGCVDTAYLTQKRFIALTLFAVNVGKAAACGSRAVRLISAGQIELGCAALATGPSGKPVWSSAGGKYIPGLQRRRQQERDLCLEGAL